MAYKNITLDQLMNGINQTESSGRYNVIGPATKKGNHAYGISQVMDFNVGPWSQQYFGQRLTPEQFLNNKEAQIAVTKGKLGELYNKYGNPADVASAWFSGQPLARAGNASDGFKNVPQYVNDVLNAAQKQDPNAMMALAPEDQPQAPQGAQSISLGGQETQQPLNNIGSTLANMGASIASLDRGGTGIASLNASRVASNLAAQEQAREAQGGWKYAGQTQNGQGLMFQNSRGEIRVEPLAPGFAGNKNDETTLQKDYAWAGGDSEKQKLLNAHYGIKDKTPVSQDTIRTLGEQVLAGNYKALTRLGEDNRVAVWDYIGKKEKDLGLPSGFILQSEAEQEARKTAEREYGRMDARRNTAGNTFLAGASTLIDLSEQMPRDHYYSVNEILNFSKKQMQDPQLSRLNAAVNTAVNEYANAITTSASGATVSDKQHARELLSSAQDHESLKGALQTMTQEVVRSKENIFMSNENRRAKAKGQEVPYPQLEGEGPGGSGVPKALEEKLKPKEAASKKPKEPSGLPEVGKKANINGVEIERLE
jgi:hypothetical protein